jgi:hypothetical protein
MVFLRWQHNNMVAQKYKILSLSQADMNIDVLPSSLIDSNVSLRWKQQKNKELGTRSLARNTLG